MAELPALGRPIPGPPLEPDFGEVDGLKLQLEDSQGQVVDEIAQKEPLRARLTFHRSKPVSGEPQRIHVRLVKYDRNGVPIIADAISGFPQSTNHSDYSLVVDLTSPPLRGEFHVVAYFQKQVLAEEPLLVLPE